MTSITAYAMERFPLRIFAPAIAFHALAAWWAAGAPVSAFMVSVAVTALLFVAFRLWDDLEDVDRDRVLHPHRVLVNGDRWPFKCVLAMLFVATVAIFARTGVGLVVLVGTICAFWAAYRFLRPRLSDPLWRFGVLLVKYPVFVVLVTDATGDAVPARLAAGALGSYLAACGYEAWHHDRRTHLGVTT